ncbi:DsbA family protein [Cohnella sp.]|uniref:DsbA family oxidoreductase n=1 Tax=Cohnella sp. TaxID=1883426 RepID=UPI0035652B3A
MIANYDPVVIANTFDAHRLVHFAAKSGKEAELTERLFRAYLSQSWNIADHNVLAALGKEAGFNEQEVVDMLGSNDYKEAVLGDMAEARKLGILRLPAFVFNLKLRILMPERMRGGSIAGNARHATIGLHFFFQGSCTNFQLPMLTNKASVF